MCTYCERERAVAEHEVRGLSIKVNVMFRFILVMCLIGSIFMIEPEIAFALNVALVVIRLTQLFLEVVCVYVFWKLVYAVKVVAMAVACAVMFVVAIVWSMRRYITYAALIVLAIAFPYVSIPWYLWVYHIKPAIEVRRLLNK